MHQIVVQKTFKCPNIFTHLFKNLLFRHFAAETLCGGRQLRKLNGAFSPQGLLCDIWAKTTDRGEWIGSGQTEWNFRYTLPTNNGFAFSSSNAPMTVVDAFCSRFQTDCRISQFLKTETENSPEEYINIFQQMKDFEEPVKPPIIVPLTKQWSIVAFIKSGEVIIGQKTFYIEAPSKGEAENRFKALYPNYRVKDVYETNQVKTYTVF